MFSVRLFSLNITEVSFLLPQILRTTAEDKVQLLQLTHTHTQAGAHIRGTSRTCKCRDPETHTHAPPLPLLLPAGCSDAHGGKCREDGCRRDRRSSLHTPQYDRMRRWVKEEEMGSAWRWTESRKRRGKVQREEENGREQCREGEEDKNEEGKSVSPSLAAVSGKGARHCCYCPSLPPSLPRSFTLTLSLTENSPWLSSAPGPTSSPLCSATIGWLSPALHCRWRMITLPPPQTKTTSPLSSSLSSLSLPLLPSLIIITMHHNLHLCHIHSVFTTLSNAAQRGCLSLCPCASPSLYVKWKRVNS